MEIFVRAIVFLAVFIVIVAGSALAVDTLAKLLDKDEK